MTIQKEYLNQTITCENCKGSGFVEMKDEIGGIKKVTCLICGGSGSVIDSKIPEIIKKHIPTVDRFILPKIMQEIYDHIEKKLQDSYFRGQEDQKYLSTTKDLQ